MPVACLEIASRAPLLQWVLVIHNSLLIQCPFPYPSSFLWSPNKGRNDIPTTSCPHTINTAPGRKILIDKRKRSCHLNPTHTCSEWQKPWATPHFTAFCHAITCLFRCGSQLDKEPVNWQQLCKVPMHCLVDTWLALPLVVYALKGLFWIVVLSNFLQTPLTPITAMTKRRRRWEGTRPPDNPHTHNIGYLYSVLHATTEDIIREVVSSSAMITKSRL